MVELDSLVTHPSKQRRGYGTALAKHVTDKVRTMHGQPLRHLLTRTRVRFRVQADALGVPTFLVSWNVANEKLHESCGFFIVAEFTLGESNPKWKGPPVVAMRKSVL